MCAVTNTANARHTAMDENATPIGDLTPERQMPHLSAPRKGGDEVSAPSYEEIIKTVPEDDQRPEYPQQYVYYRDQAEVTKPGFWEDHKQTVALGVIVFSLLFGCLPKLLQLFPRALGSTENRVFTSLVGSSLVAWTFQLISRYL